MICECDRCFKKCDEVYEVNDDYICLDCLENMNNKFELLVELVEGKNE